LERLSTADLFHFAGHGISDEASGWDSALLLAGDEQLTPAELLVQEHAPRWVVLSGCHTARGNRLGQVEAAGLAQAFLAAGSRQVVATTRPLDDQAGAELFADFYGRLAIAEQPWDLAQVLRETQLAARQRDLEVDWASLRVLEP
jgi:CHAT domain-containing protein